MSYKYEDIRNFYFENEYGQRIDCQKVNGNLFLYNISGLGFEKNTEYVKVGSRYITNKEDFVQIPINGELEFDEMTYDEYSNFVDFILQANSLKLIYVPKKSARTEYFRDVDVTQLVKEEEDDFNVLTCPITMIPKSLWYERNDIIYTAEIFDDELRWDFEWDSRFADYENRNIIFENKGHVEASFLLELNGYLKNPAISIYVDNEKKYELALNLILERNEKIIYSTEDDNLRLCLIDENGNETNLFNELDLNKINFFKIPKGVSELRLTADNEILNSKLTIFVEYIAV